MRFITQARTQYIKKIRPDFTDEEIRKLELLPDNESNEILITQTVNLLNRGYAQLDNDKKREQFIKTIEPDLTNEEIRNRMSLHDDELKDVLEDKLEDELYNIFDAEDELEDELDDLTLSDNEDEEASELVQSSDDEEEDIIGRLIHGEELSNEEEKLLHEQEIKHDEKNLVLSEIDELLQNPNFLTKINNIIKNNRAKYKNANWQSKSSVIRKVIEQIEKIIPKYKSFPSSSYEYITPIIKNYIENRYNFNIS